MRPWEGSEEQSGLEWIEALPDAPCITTWSAIGMTEWTRKPYPHGVGEVPEARRTFTGKKAPAGLDGSHVCATDHEIEFGGKYLPDDPPAEYDTQGYLVCCAVPAPAVPVLLSSNPLSPFVGVTEVTYEARGALGGGVPGWIGIRTPTDVPLRFTWDIVGPPDTYTVKGYKTRHGDALFFLFETTTPGACETFVVDSEFNDALWVSFIGTQPIAQDFRVTLRVDLGACP